MTSVAQRRKVWEAAQDANGKVFCWRCGLLIDPVKQEWHVGHVDKAKSFGGKTVAPEHKDCNMMDAYQTVIPAVAKSNRVWSAHHEKRASRNPIPGGKRTMWKKKYNRETGRFETVKRN